VKRRVAAALLVVAALGLHFGVTRPARRQRDEAREAFARAREQRERLRAEAVRLERRAEAGRAPAGEAAAARALRLSLLHAIDGLPLGGVRVAAESGKGSALAARGTLVAVGRQADLLLAAGRLADPSSGVRLERVSLVEARGGDVRLEVDAFSVRGRT
jgi:predicted phage gp36 major capsid-like protein